MFKSSVQNKIEVIIMSCECYNTITLCSTSVCPASNDHPYLAENLNHHHMYMVGYSTIDTVVTYKHMSCMR